MNKYFWIAIVGALVIGGGIVYRVFLIPAENLPVTTGQIKEVTVVAKKDTWSFVPEEVEVNRGDKVILTVINEDNYDHGIGIDAYGISQRMPANQTIKIQFVATQAGEFPLYCSVPCGEGIVNGKKRGHFDMIGKLKVRNIVQPQ
mgnify:CR=1 FL=1